MRKTKIIFQVTYDIFYKQRSQVLKKWCDMELEVYSYQIYYRKGQFRGSRALSLLLNAIYQDYAEHFAVRTKGTIFNDTMLRILVNISRETHLRIYLLGASEAGTVRSEADLHGFSVDCF